MSVPVARPASLLATDEPPPVRLVNANGRGAFVLLCDHAANRVPRALDQLGLSPAQLASHIAWDPGAAAVARLLARRLDAPLLESGWSRLVIDCNRPPDSPEAVPAVSAGVPVPGNQGLSPAAREQRRMVLFQPYHQAIARLLNARARRPTRLLSIHSFTPVLEGVRRPWAVGVSHRHDGGLGALLLAALDAEPGLAVGDNQPYAIEDAYDYTLPTHGETRGLPNAMIELRQDGLCTPAAIATWAERLARACARLPPVADDGRGCRG